MKNLIETLKNIWKIEDLRQRILITVGFLLVYRFGSYIPLPGINPGELSALHAQTSDGLLGLLNAFTGGAFANASILALGIMPYISASIVVQLMGMAVPYLAKLQKEGESGRKKINQITRWLTIGITLVQAPGYITNLKAQLPPQAFLLNDGLFWFSGIVILVAGTVFTMWLGEKITDKGIGNGISLIIMVGIMARFPQSIAQEFVDKVEAAGGGLVILLVEAVFWMLVILVSILLVQGTRRIPVQYARRSVASSSKFNMGGAVGARQYIPLKVNAAGVMPIIFAQAIMFIPVSLFGLVQSDSMQGMVAIFSNINGLWYNLVFGLLIVLFTYFYTAITVPTNQMADDIKRNGGFVPGIKPGKDTSDYLDTIMSRITLPGSLFLALIAVLPALAYQAGVNQSFALFFGGTSLLIMVGVVLDTLQQVNSHLLNRHYDGLMKSGKLRGKAEIA
ncbi:MAG: preprotein translocase subunit SecY [Bacteroidota bacterium]